MKHRLGRFVGFALLAVLVFLLGVAGFIAHFDAELPASKRTDAAIVLGAAVYGGKPSPVLQGRLEYALQLLRERRVRVSIVTGGARSGRGPSEAQVSAQFLRAHGVASAHILLETRSTTTRENLCFAAQLGAQSGLGSYALVTDPLHEARAMLLAHDMGLRATPAATPYTRFTGGWIWLKFLARETYLYAGSLLWARPECGDAVRR